MFTPIRTSRLIIRALNPGDAPDLAVRRSHPQVAEYQAWSVPYPADRAQVLVSEMVAMGGPSEDEWWMAAVEESATGVVVGDLALRLSWGGRSAEIGYTLAREHWGRGYATEAVASLVAHLFTDREVSRVSATLHPDNVASAMVLERTGFRYEGCTRSSFWVGDVVSDDLIYGMTRADWKQWRDRPRTPPLELRLVPVTTDNHSAVVELETHKSQERFVAPVVQSFADALFPEVVAGAPVVPWMRGVEADGALAGFVMLAEPTGHHPEPYLWRLLIDRLHQRRGIGGRLLGMVRDECRAMGAGSLLTSWVEGRGSPASFYRSQGFEPTGEVVEGEIEARWRFG